MKSITAPVPSCFIVIPLATMKTISVAVTQWKILAASRYGRTA
jgi:hypothetical protein